MTQHSTQTELATLATITSTPGPAPLSTKLTAGPINRSFELPPALYAITVGCYLGFLALMSALFMTPELALPMVAFVISILGGFGLCYKWVAMKPDHACGTLTSGQFAHRGIQTLSGRLTATEASVQVLILPVLLMVWGLAIATICAFVR